MDKNNLKYQIYKLDNDNEINAVVKDETIWLTQKAMAELFDVGVPAVSKHLSNIFEDGELDESSTVSKMETVQNEGTRTVKRDMIFYNLDAIISVGYRVNSLKATRFRQWATKILKEFMTKGFVLDDERLKQGEITFGKDYFRELLERVRSIRTSERRIWLQLTDIFAEISADYDKDSPLTREFYAMMQNKFHFAITGHTAAEIIFDRVDSQHDNMGLKTVSKIEAEEKAHAEYAVFNKTQKINSDFERQLTRIQGQAASERSDQFPKGTTSPQIDGEVKNDGE